MSERIQARTGTDVMATAAEELALTQFSVCIFIYLLRRKTCTCVRLKGPGFSHAADITLLNVRAPGRA